MSGPELSLRSLVIFKEISKDICENCGSHIGVQECNLCSENLCRDCYTRSRGGERISTKSPVCGGCDRRVAPPVLAGETGEEEFNSDWQSANKSVGDAFETVWCLFKAPMIPGSFDDMHSMSPAKLDYYGSDKTPYYLDSAMMASDLFGAPDPSGEGKYRLEEIYDDPEQFEEDDNIDFWGHYLSPELEELKVMGRKDDNTGHATQNADGTYNPIPAYAIGYDTRNREDLEGGDVKRVCMISQNILTILHGNTRTWMMRECMITQMVCEGLEDHFLMIKINTMPYLRLLLP